MKKFIIFPLLLIASIARGQDVISQMQKEGEKTKGETINAAFALKSAIVTLALGGIDYYKTNYSVPAGFEKNNTSGFAPVYARVEYGITHNVSIGAVFSYDAFYSNYYQLFAANNIIYKRFKTDKMRIFSAGIAANYHLGKYIKVKRLDTYAGIGFSLNNIHHSALPQGDSTIDNSIHTVSPSLKIGARYYLTNRASIFADAGFDRQSAFSLGFSCRFFKISRF